MRENIHPNYRFVVVCDTSCGFMFLTRSTCETKETISWEGFGELPLLKVEISSESHPFYTGEKNSFINISSVEKFRKKYGKKNLEKN